MKRLMRVWLVIALLAAALPAGAQLEPPTTTAPQIGMPAQSFGFFQCFCTTTTGGPVPSQFGFAPQAARQWNGSVYASTDRDAASKAQRVCSAERRGSLFDCLNCRCNR